MEPKKILIVTTKFSGPTESPWLTNDLAEALDAQGHKVTVLLSNWSEVRSTQTMNLYRGTRLVIARVWRMPAVFPRIVQLSFKWFFSVFFAQWIVPREIRDENYDLLIGFSPAVATYGLVHLMRKKVRRKLIIYWDFFPIHQSELGTIPKSAAVLKLAYASEAAAINLYDIAGCMSPRNQQFFKKYFPKFTRPILHIPVWGPPSLIPRVDRDMVKEKYGISRDKVVAVFGGQLVPGRDIESLCSLALAMRSRIANICFVVAGAGPLSALVKETADRSGGALAYLGALSRKEYGELLSCADIGLVLTPPHVSVPTFPSKIVDYFRSGISTFASTEVATDFGSILQDEIKGGLACAGTDESCKIASLERLVDSPDFRRECGERAQRYYLEHMTATSVASKVATLAR